MADENEDLGSVEDSQPRHEFARRWTSPLDGVCVSRRGASSGRIGRSVFGFLASLSSLTLAGFAALAIIGQPAGVGAMLFRVLLVEALAFASLFMLLAAIYFFGGGSGRIERLLNGMAPKAIAVIFALALGVCVLAEFGLRR
jgi:hypothetical protein